MKKRKSIVTLTLACLIIAAFCFQTSAASRTRTIDVTYSDIKIYVDGELAKLRDVTGATVEPFIYNGTTYLPVRAISEALGQSVSWDGKTNSVFIGEQPAAEIETITVSTAAEFVAALGSNREILVKSGEYNLTNALDEAAKNENISLEEVFDGVEYLLSNIRNLTIRGIGDAPSELVIEPRYAFVLSFTGGSNISIENITAGHTDSGYCAGGVFSFARSYDIEIDNTHMYGCGTEGLRLNNVSGMTVTGSTIYECTYYIMTVENSRDIKFENCTFRDNEGYSMVNITGTNGLAFEGCKFERNVGENEFFSVRGSSEIKVIDSTFTDNGATELDPRNGVEGLLTGNTFEGNTFRIPR